MATGSSFAPFKFLSTGAAIQSWKLGELNVQLHFSTEEQYQKHNDYYFGATLGRVANRISGAKLTNIDGHKNYTLPANEGPNTLHAGLNSWGRKRWDGPVPLVPGKAIQGLDGDKVEGEETMRFALTSPHLDEGFPGTVKATIDYTAGWQTNDQGTRMSVLQIEYEAELVGDAAETVVNMTNHSYFNLTGAPTISGTEVTLCTAQHLPKDEQNIPASGPEPFPGIKAHEKLTIGDSWPVVDHCFIVNEDPSSIPIDTRNLPLQRMVETYHPQSQIHVNVWGTEPAFQFYTGENTRVPAIGGLPAQGSRSAFCVEPSRYVNAPQEEAWRRMVLLKKGEKYGSRIVYQGWADQAA